MKARPLFIFTTMIALASIVYIAAPKQNILEAEQEFLSSFIQSINGNFTSLENVEQAIGSVLAQKSGKEEILDLFDQITDSHLAVVVYQDGVEIKGKNEIMNSDPFVFLSYENYSWILTYTIELSFTPTNDLESLNFYGGPCIKKKHPVIQYYYSLMRSLFYHDSTKNMNPKTRRLRGMPSSSAHPASYTLTL